MFEGQGFPTRIESGDRKDQEFCLQAAFLVGQPLDHTSSLGEARNENQRFTTDSCCLLMLLTAPCCDPRVYGLETDVGSEQPEVPRGGEGREKADSQ